MSFTGKEALIVGGGNGMGLATAKMLVQAGVTVTLVGRSLDKNGRVFTNLAT